MILVIVWSVCSLFLGDKGGSGLRGLVLGVEISSPLVFDGPGGTKSLGMLSVRNLGA